MKVMKLKNSEISEKSENMDKSKLHKLEDNLYDYIKSKKVAFVSETKEDGIYV